MRGVKPGAAFIVTACSYEAASIVTGRAPTITALTRARHPYVRVAALSAFTGWLWLHMMRPQP